MSFQDFDNAAASSRIGIASTAASQDPSQAIAAGIFQINTSVSTFKRQVNSLGTSKDTPELREKLHKTRQLIGQLAKDVSAKLKSATETAKNTEVTANKRVGDAKLAKDFQTVLNEYQKAQRTAAEKEATYSPILPKIIKQEPSSQDDVYEESIQHDELQEKQALLRQQRRQEIIQLESEVVFNEAMIEERDQGIRDIQQQIGEVNEIFKDLAVLVHEQGVMIDDIDSHVESSYSTTTQAKSQLVKASKSQKSNSSLICWLVVIFVVVLLVVIIVLVVIY